MIRRIAGLAAGVMMLLGVAAVSAVTVAEPMSTAGVRITEDSGRDQHVEANRDFSMPAFSTNGDTTDYGTNEHEWGSMAA